MQKYAVIVAGGSGTRMGGEVPKQFQLLKGKPVLWHTLKAFIDAYDDMQLILVLPENHMERGEQIAKEFPMNRIRITTGGATRFHSVKNGLRLVDAHSLVFVHDGVRCLVTPQLIRRCGEAALEKDNAIPSVAAIETVRIQSGDGNEPIDRNRVRIIQTPQTFFSNVIKQAFEQPYQESFTDEATVVEKMGIRINLIEGERTNIKITTPIDLMVAERILEERVMEKKSN
ncbi:MAG TPA: 2-C-methyl-D-erythritol 4-phosphate cytidylyltransferase [Chitinophagaceae bacterium]|nr:2-C-methyl-D-erythritol 4-phosphate cytidylyltransferase [Chitinophagaceae bacterium]